MWRWPLVLFAVVSSLWMELPANARLPSKKKALKQSGQMDSAERDPPIPPTSAGPTNSKEAIILLRDGKEAFEEGDFQKAAYLLQRLVDRYPGYNGYLAAHLMLGKARLELHDPKRALRPLKYYVGATSKSIESIPARLDLAEAYLRLKLPNEALLTAYEAEMITSSPETVDKHADSLLLKARALMALNRDLRASSALDAAKKILARPEAPIASRANAALIEQNLKLKACAKFPSSGIDEGQLRHQLEQRGQCLNEAVVLFKKVLDVGYDPSASQGAADLSEAFISYYQASYKPRTPTGKRSPEELTRFRAELRTILLADAHTKLAAAGDLMENWRESLPEPQRDAMMAHVRLVAKTLERLK